MAIRKYNPIERSRREFLELPEERRYFPSVGQGRTGLSSYVSPDFAAASRAEMDAFEDEQDQRVTGRMRNQTSRLEMAGRQRILPFSTEASIAAEKAKRAQMEADERNSPFLEESQREIARTNADEAASQRRLMPAKEQVQAREFERAVSGEDDLKRDGVDPLIYDFHYRTLDKALPPRERQRQARNAALRLQNDQPYVAAIEDEALESGDMTIRDKYVEDVIDEETGARFSRIKKGVPPAEVNSLLRKRAYSKERVAREKAEQAMAREERIANAAFDNNRLMALKEAKATAMLTAKDDAADPELRAAARKELSELDAAIKEIVLRPTVRPERAKAGEESPAPTPAAEEKKPTKTSYLEEARKAALGE